MADFSLEKKQPEYRQYDPYRDLGLQVPIRNLYNLPTSPEYLYPEQAVDHRSFGENLQYYTGLGYSGGAILGSVKGTFKGLGMAEPGETVKLRLSRVLNSGGQTGRAFGNTLGILGLIFAGCEGAIVYQTGSDNMMNSVLAGLGTGAIYRAAAGPRSAAIAGAIGGLAAAAAVAGKQVARRYVPI